MADSCPHTSVLIELMVYDMTKCLPMPLSSNDYFQRFLTEFDDKRPRFYIIRYFPQR